MGSQCLMDPGIQFGTLKKVLEAGGHTTVSMRLMSRTVYFKMVNSVYVFFSFFFLKERVS